MKRIIIGIAIVVIFAVAYWLLSPLFIKTMSNEVPISVVNQSLAAAGTFVDGEPGHHAQGGIEVFYSQEQNQYLLQFGTDFEVTNGPDLFVYLGKNREVLVGALKGSVGAQQYMLPEGVDPTQYGEVVIWCRAFSVKFGSGEIRNINTLQ